MDQSAVKRFEDKCIPVTESGCWIWLAGLRSKSNPRGLFRYQGEKMQAHRASWLIYRGEIPDGLLVCHKCDVGICVNPNHLFLGTALDNIHDRDSKGHQVTPLGEKHGKSVLSDEQVREVRATKLPQRKLAKKYGVSHTCIASITSRKTWTHI